MSIVRLDLDTGLLTICNELHDKEIKKFVRLCIDSGSILLHQACQWLAAWSFNEIGIFKKMCVGIIYKYFSHSSFEIQSAPKNLLEVEFGKLNAA